jgi:hypothetical protein
MQPTRLRTVWMLAMLQPARAVKPGLMSVDQTVMVREPAGSKLLRASLCLPVTTTYLGLCLQKLHLLPAYLKQRQVPLHHPAQY